MLVQVQLNYDLEVSLSRHRSFLSNYATLQLDFLFALST